MHDIVIDHFRKKDPVMGKLAAVHSGLELTPSGDYFAHLAESIVSQQLSDKAATTIWNRFEALVPGSQMTPAAVTRIPVKLMRQAGMSGAKAEYIHNLADAFLSGELRSHEFRDLTDEEVADRLISVRGIGRWTAEMFLIFALGRPDVYSFGDAGLVRAMQTLYGKKRKLSRRQQEKIAAVWSPYRSYACLLLWKSLA